MRVRPLPCVWLHIAAGRVHKVWRCLCCQGMQLRVHKYHPAPCRVIVITPRYGYTANYTALLPWMNVPQSRPARPRIGVAWSHEPLQDLLTFSGLHMLGSTSLEKSTVRVLSHHRILDSASITCSLIDGMAHQDAMDERHSCRPGDFMDGSSSRVSRTGPKWLTAKCISWPCFDCVHETF